MKPVRMKIREIGKIVIRVSVRLFMRIKVAFRRFFNIWMYDFSK